MSALGDAIIACMRLGMIISGVVLAFSVSAVAAPWANVSDYLPDDAKLDGSVDLREALQTALDENAAVVLQGSGDPDKPLVYGVRIPAGKSFGLMVPEGHTLRAEPGAVIRRLPSKRALIHVGKRARLVGVTVDGNKHAHYPTYEDLGKSDFGILMLGECVVEDCTVYDIPGIAFGTYAGKNVVRRCTARNAGYIDLKFNADYYQGKWDNWSGDGFYMRGHHNVVIDCVAIDCFRWAYTTSHENSGSATYINCEADMPTWKTYGFIDIEACDGGGSTMIHCTSPKGTLAISTDGCKLYHCEAGAIAVNDADHVEIVNCTTRGGGLAVGGWTSALKTQVRGGNQPVVVGNTINKYQADSGVPEVSDWSLSVFSADGKGLVAGNVLNEFAGPDSKGPGMKLDNVVHHDNVVRYGEAHRSP